MDQFILEWIADYCTGRINAEEAGKLREWIDKASENRELFEQYLKTVKINRMVEGADWLDEERAWQELAGKIRRGRIKSFYRRLSLGAAVVIIFIGLGMAFWQRNKLTEQEVQLIQILPGSTKATLILANGSQIDLTRGDLKEVITTEALIENDSLLGLQYNHIKLRDEQPVFHTVKVPVAGEYHFTLSDGTKVWMNSDSELRFPVNFTSNRREIFIKGEAYFEVEPDRERPFIVHANQVSIQVLRTKFNVSAYGESQQVLTTLVQGGVNVKYAGLQTELQPGFQAVTDIKAGTMDRREVEVGMYTSWTKGIFEYENMPLSDIAVQLSRWYDVRIIFAAPEFANRRFTGVVRKYDVLNDVLSIIEQTTDVCFIVNGKEIVVKATGLD